MTPAFEAAANRVRRLAKMLPNYYPATAMNIVYGHPIKRRDALMCADLNTLVAAAAGEEFLEFKEALSDLRSLRQEHRDLTGGGPDWSERNKAAWARVDELFADEDGAAYDRQQESFYG